MPELYMSVQINPYYQTVVIYPFSSLEYSHTLHPPLFFLSKFSSAHQTVKYLLAISRLFHQQPSTNQRLGYSNEIISQFLVLSASMSELLIARKINSLDEVVKASRIGKKKKFHNLIRTDMNDMINERDKEFANEFSHFVNGKMCSASKVGAEFANDHRFLVNEKFKVMMAFMEQLAINYQKGYYDLRNEWACTLAHAAIEALREQQLYYPSSSEYSPNK